MTLELNFDNVADLVRSGHLNANTHEGLTIYNYTEKTQREKHWTPETLVCRGLIFNDHGDLVSRPFPKFFNFEEHGPDNPYGPVPLEEDFEAFEKLDGSLGISYFHKGQWRVATRDTFTGPQARFATHLLNQKYGTRSLDPAVTYMFEIIYPDNRHVVNYDNAEELVLLGMIETETGQEVPLSSWARNGSIMRTAPSFGRPSLEWLMSDLPNREGYVLRFESGTRVKIKLPTYWSMTKLPPLTLQDAWIYMKDRKNPFTLAEKLPPDHRRTWLKLVNSLLLEAAEFEINHKNAAQLVLAGGGTRKEQAAAIQTLAADRGLNKHVLFRMLDGKDYFKLIWEMVKPPNKHAHVPPL